MDEILTEFRSEYPEPEDETMEEDLPADEPEEEREAPQEEKTEYAAEPEEAPLYSVRDILRDYRLMTMESRYAEVERKREDRAEGEEDIGRLLSVNWRRGWRVPAGELFHAAKDVTGTAG